MTPQEIKKHALAYIWEPWLERPCGAFVLSLMARGTRRAIIQKKLGVSMEWRAFVCERGKWYISHEVAELAKKDIARAFARNGRTIFDITRACEKFYREKKKRIAELNASSAPVARRMREFIDIMSYTTACIWLAHGLDEFYTERLEQEVPLYMQGDTAKNIGDICFPSKKTAHARFEDAIRSGADLARVQKEFGWIKVRYELDEGFTIQELRDMRSLMKKQKVKHPQSVVIPRGLKHLAREAQELVYFRTFRTDIFCEFIFLARPLLQEFAKRFSLGFKDLRNYSAEDLLKGKAKRYPSEMSCVCYKGNTAFFIHHILTHRKQSAARIIKGSVAFRGKARGVVKIVRTVADLDKVQEGDIMVTQMTFPSFIAAMKRASAFVTDEGGITCHAAIVAREMQKPCIIGTKIATQVLKDGDVVGVDAEKGVVHTYSVSILR